MTQYLQQPGMITIAPDFTGVALDKVPAGYYRIGFNREHGFFYLSEVEPLQVADKIYGNLLEHLPRIEAAFAASTGKPISVMLEGLKGSGKSLLMKTLAKRFVELEDGIVLMCNAPFTGDGYFEFLQKITQKKIVLMDEFDKVYKEKDDRNNILTLLDGNFASHTLFVLTMNQDISSGAFEFFHNRPGRVMINVKFKGVPEDAIREYAEDHLDDQDKLPELMQFVKRFTDFNMDMLSKLVAEVNYATDKNLEQISEYLNVKPDLTLDDVFFKARYLRNGVDVTKHIHGNTTDYEIKKMLRGMNNPSMGDTHLNLMLRGSQYCNKTTGQEWDRVKDPHETNIVAGQFIQVGRGKREFIQSFDEYLYANDTKKTQDPKTGEITLKCNSDENTDWVITLVPEVLKRYKYAF